MLKHTLYDDGERSWICFGRDPSRPEHVVDTNQVLIRHRGRGMLVDPGGVEVFAPFVAQLTSEIDFQDIDILFATHQDPDVISSLSLWLEPNPNLRCHASWTWESFLPHLAAGRKIVPVPDEGMTFKLGGSNDIVAVPAHYCHSSGNFSVYDPRAKILFSGDLGAALLPAGAPLYVEDFGSHTRNMEGFHKRWMPSNRAKNDWVRRVRQLEVEQIVPQHGAIFRGDDVKRFLDWLESLDVGSAVG